MIKRCIAPYDDTALIIFSGMANSFMIAPE